MKKNKGLALAILSVSFLLMLRLTISPALATIGKAFPGVSQGQLMNMVTLASLMAIPFGFLAGILATKIKTRTLLFTGLGLYLVGGLGPIFATDFTLILVLRCFLGAGTGLFLPFAAGLIADFYEGEERNTMLGFQSTAVALGNIVTSALAGFLATISWRLSFLIYAFAFVTLLLVAIKVPEPVRAARAREEKVFNGRLVSVLALIFLYAIIYFSFFGYLSFVVEARQLGDAAITGLATMVMTLMSMITGLFFGKLVRLFQRFSFLVGVGLNAIGFFLLSTANVIGLIFLGAAFIGLGFGFIMPYGTMKATDAVPKAAATFANGMFMTFINVGTAVSPLLLIQIGNLFQNPDGQFIYRFCAICLAVAGLVSLVLAVLRE